MRQKTATIFHSTTFFRHFLPQSLLCSTSSLFGIFPFGVFHLNIVDIVSSTFSFLGVFPIWHFYGQSIKPPRIHLKSKTKFSLVPIGPMRFRATEIADSECLWSITWAMLSVGVHTIYIFGKIGAVFWLHKTVPSTERRVLRNKSLFVCLSVCLSVTGSKRTLPGRTQTVIT